MSIRGRKRGSERRRRQGRRQFQRAWVQFRKRGHTRWQRARGIRDARNRNRHKDGERERGPQGADLLDDLAELASLLTDPDSLDEASHSKEKGRGQTGGGLWLKLKGRLAQLLLVASVFGGAVKELFKKLFEKLERGILKRARGGGAQEGCQRRSGDSHRRRRGDSRSKRGRLPRKLRRLPRKLEKAAEEAKKAARRSSDRLPRMPRRLQKTPRRLRRKPGRPRRPGRLRRRARNHSRRTISPYSGMNRRTRTG